MRMKNEKKPCCFVGLVWNSKLGRGFVETLFVGRGLVVSLVLFGLSSSFGGVFSVSDFFFGGFLPRFLGFAFRFLGGKMRR